MDEPFRRFELHRRHDPTGISGIGVVAEGVQFTDKTVVLRWVVGQYRSTVLWPGIEAVRAIHGHDGATEVVWK